MWQTVELREIRIFLVLAEELHFGRTVARVGLTQSRVSQSVRALERKLGLELASRTSRRVTLTAPGERFRDEAGAALAGLEDVLRTAQESGRRVTEPVRLRGISAAAAGPRPRAVIPALQASHPHSPGPGGGPPLR